MSETSANDRRNPGRVILVGAGPGRPDLITLRGVECLRRADVVVLDALVDRRVLAHARPSVRVIDAGKRGDGRVRMTQEQINHLLVRLAKQGKTVVRLKGGDPYFFGRGAEEAECLVEHGIPFEAVPGVSSVTAVPGFAGIPLTHRGHASVVTVVTGHEGRENPYLGESAGEARRRRGPGVDWSRLSPDSTLVILMGVKQLPRIADRLQSLGWPGKTPVAVVQWGSWSQQKSVRGTLRDIAARTRRHRLGAPATIVVGAVAGLGKTLNWFEHRPLFGRTVLVLRAAGQSSELTVLLEEAGARVIESPVIRIHPLPIGPRGRSFLRALPLYDGILLTSANAARLFAAFPKKGSLPPVFAVGEKTADVLRENGISVRAVPETYRAEGLLKTLGKSVRGKRFLFPRAESGRDTLIRGLARRGARVDLWPLYRTRPVPLTPEARAALRNGQVDAVTFTSGSTVRAFLENFNKVDARRLLSPLRAVSIGPITSAALRSHGVRVAKVADAATASALADAVVRAVRRS